MTGVHCINCYSPNTREVYSPTVLWQCFDCGEMWYHESPEAFHEEFDLYGPAWRQ